MTITNALTYCATEFIMVIKSFMLQAPGANFITKFVSNLLALLCKLGHIRAFRKIWHYYETAKFTKSVRVNALQNRLL